MTSEQIKEITLKVSQANHSGLILILTDVVRIYITDFVSCYENEDMVGYTKYNELAKRALNELISAFNPANAQGREVISLLRYIYGKLVESGVKKKPCDTEQSLSILDRLKPGFERLHELDSEGPVMKNTHQVYAGLTYGKGTLNESVDAPGQNRRGFFA